MLERSENNIKYTLSAVAQCIYTELETAIFLSRRREFFATMPSGPLKCEELTLAVVGSG
jgi:hypothetical protein